ncbi:PREDICTED: uncharacterized protein At3g60930, chloroplastic-like [Camelina sativa]|uniref:Uncharacterized protein At3g60930, chloroplastic-like n=1 Tax=Camelina sativa TaxID=90675 RepID=A0ABM1R2K3_CAMSA|nr:PREDICTED: uncharacterized protein At3g60930, chloroplastic-like [Camelina sativa]
MMLPPGDPYTPETVPPGYCCAYTTYFEQCGLVFPIPGIILRILQRLRIAFPQMCPNFVRHVIGLYTRGREVGLELGVDDILRLCQIKHNSGFPGTLYTCRRQDREIIQAIPGKDDRWREKYFYFRVSPASVGDFNFARLPTQWAVCVDSGDHLNTHAVQALTERLRGGEIRWSLFSRACIITALNAPVIQALVPAVPPGVPSQPIPADRPRRNRFEHLPARQGMMTSHAINTPTHPRISSSSSSSTPLLAMTRKPTLRELREQAQPSRRVRAGDVDAALASAFQAARPEPVQTGSEEVNQAVATPAGSSAPPREVMLVSSRSTPSEPAPPQKRARAEGPRTSKDQNRESRESRLVGDQNEHPGGEQAAYGNGSSTSRSFGEGSHGEGGEAYINAMASQAQAEGCPPISRARDNDCPEASQEREAVSAGKVDSLDHEIASLRASQEKLVEVEAELASAKVAQAKAAGDRDLLLKENRWLKEKSAEAGRLHAETTRKVVYEAKMRMSQDYRSILDSVKSKWELKKQKSKVDGDLAEIESNLLMIKQISEGKITVEDELKTLESQKAAVTIRSDSLAVSDFSVSKLDLPQVSEDSIAPMEIDTGTGVPRGFDEHRSNAKGTPDLEAGTGEEDA